MSTPPPFSPTFRPKYVSTHNRAQIVRALLIAGAILSALTVVLVVVDYAFGLSTGLEEESPSPALIAAGLLIVGLALIEFAVYVATVVLFLMWLYRSHENLLAFGVSRQQLEYSSGWAVGSFFVPFVCLVVPYRAVRETWRKSIPDQSSMFSDPSPPAIFPLWWAAWLVAGFGNQIYLRTMFRTDLSPEFDLVLGVVTSILDIISAAFAILVVKEIDRQQLASEALIQPDIQYQQPPMPPQLFEPAPS